MRKKKTKTVKKNKAPYILFFLASLALILSVIFVVPNIRTKEEKLEQRAEEIVSQMTLEQKIGQKLMVSFRYCKDENGELKGVTEMNGDIENAIKRYGFGGVILFAQNCAGTEQTARLVYDMQNAAKNSPAKLPLLVSVDQEGGTITRLATGTSMISAMGLAATGSESNAREDAKIIGSELSALGINVDFAPDMDVNNDPDNPVIGVRSFSSDAQKAASFGTAFIKGLHKTGTMTAVKHFPGHGDTATDSHTGLPMIDKSLDELESLELIPFRAAVKDTDMVMTAHIQYPQIETQTYKSIKDGKKVYLPATLSETMITGVLREKLGYDGVVVTDALNMDAVAKNFAPMDAAKLALNADVDILLMPVELTTAEDMEKMGEYIDGIVKMVSDGDIPVEQIDRSVKRIVKLKLEYGLLDGEEVPVEQIVENAKKTVGSREHHEKEWSIAKKSVTAVKNENKVTKIKANDNVLLLVPNENEMNSAQFAVDRLAADGKLPAETAVTVMVYKGSETETVEKAVSDADIIVFGAETTGRASMDAKAEKGWQASFGSSLIEMAHARNKKVTFVSFQLPYDAACYTEADSILLVYNYSGMATMPESFDGETPKYGASIPAGFYAALGGCEAKGRLPVDIYALDDEMNYTDTILYPAQ